MFDYLARRIDSPFAWAASFGGSLAVTGALVAVQEYGFQGALLTAVSMAAAGGLFGWLWGSVIRVVFGLSGGLDRPVRRPDRWAMPLRCVSCEWRTTPDGPWTRRDCLLSPTACPDCASPVIPLVANCPRCERCSVAAGSLWAGMRSQVRCPKSREAGFWGDFTCRECGCDFDRWGREIQP